jgi:hypothetical protein
MSISALRTESVGVPTTPGNRVPLDPIQLTPPGTEHRYKRILECASVYRRLKESLTSSAKLGAPLDALQTILSNCA